MLTIAGHSRITQQYTGIYSIHVDFQERSTIWHDVYPHGQGSAAPVRKHVQRTGKTALADQYVVPSPALLGKKVTPLLSKSAGTVGNNVCANGY